MLPVRSERVALFPRETELWPDLLKDGFNCPERGQDGVRPVFIRGERRENIALWGRDRYIGGKQNSSN
ncbi:hypothetical protein [Bradyrhizobium sp. CCGUVB14]|uniref:hypothetical protein n=1 Tax=Bradyrhizobium sp. CCGUVB14 TaxID=2949628 RepID=UPI0020B3D14B|nr:hypothetical protein [Bradyrhizobium sp. CCGUVB14]MCP3446498.1 hypothetical protein [Bradyrhizobium sp. CCGUVB14]